MTGKTYIHILKRELEEEIEKERKKMSALNVEEDAKKKEHQGGEREDLGGHYKGKVNKNGLISKRKFNF